MILTIIRRRSNTTTNFTTARTSCFARTILFTAPFTAAFLGRSCDEVLLRLLWYSHELQDRRSIANVQTSVISMRSGFIFCLFVTFGMRDAQPASPRASAFRFVLGMVEMIDASICQNLATENIKQDEHIKKEEGDSRENVTIIFQ